MFHVCSWTWFFPAAVWGEAEGIAELFETYCARKVCQLSRTCWIEVDIAFFGSPFTDAYPW
jgi:hypothetical protein